MRAVCIGECMAEMRQADRGLYALGFAGDAYNAAVYLKRSAPHVQVAPMIRLADVFRASGEDVALLTGAREPETQIGALRACGAHEIALTLGAAGCIVATQDGTAALPALAVEVKDTSGAGDAFTGAYLAARLSSAAPVDAAAAALKIASRVVTYSGAIAPREISHPEATRC